MVDEGSSALADVPSTPSSATSNPEVINWQEIPNGREGKASSATRLNFAWLLLIGATCTQCERVGSLKVVRLMKLQSRN